MADCDRDRTADISCAMIVRRDFDALKTFVVDGDGDGGDRDGKTVVRRRNFGRLGRQPDRKAGTRGLQESQPQKWLCKQEKNTPSMKFHTSLT